jgi:hypothetical protein
MSWYRCPCVLTAITLRMIPLLALAGIAACSDAQDTGGLRNGVAVVVEERSAMYNERIGDSLGKIVEARFLAGAELVLVLDRHPPHLKLFTAAGDLLYETGGSGDGPLEFRRPVALASDDSVAYVVQHGRLTVARVEGDSLRLVQHALPTELRIRGVVHACGDLHLYGLHASEASRSALNAPITWLYRAVTGPTGVQLIPVWSDSVQLVRPAAGWSYPVSVDGF